MKSLRLAALHAAKALGGFALARRLTRGHLRILCYHAFELDDESSFRPQLFIRGATFGRRLDMVARLGMRVVPLGEALQRWHERRLHGDEVVLTIDDGFHSVSRVALPLLAARGWPATIYLTSYYVQREAPVFRLAVQYMLWKCKHDRAELPVEAWPQRTLDLRDARAVAAAEEALTAYGETRCNQPQREALCDALGAALGVRHAGIVQQRLLHLMTPEELRAAAAQGADIELHTHRHRFPAADPAACAAEIADNRRAIETWTGRRAGHFCYPSGEWEPHHWPLLQAQGVQSATTCELGLNAPGAPVLALRRVLDGEHVHAIEFEAALCGFTSVVRTGLQRLRRRRAAVPVASAHVAG